MLFLVFNPKMVVLILFKIYNLGAVFGNNLERYKIANEFVQLTDVSVVAEYYHKCV